MLSLYQWLVSSGLVLMLCVQYSMQPIENKIQNANKGCR